MQTAQYYLQRVNYFFELYLTSFYTRILFNRYCLWMLTFVNERVYENPLTNIFWMDRNLTIARFHPNDTYILMVWSRKEACRVISLHPTSNYIKKKDTNECKCCIFSKHYWNISSQVIILWIPISFSNVWLISFLWIFMIRHSPAKQYQVIHVSEKKYSV